MSNIFHLSNTSAAGELRIPMKGQWLRHNPNPIYLGTPGTGTELLSTPDIPVKDYRENTKPQQSADETDWIQLGCQCQYSANIQSQHWFCFLFRVLLPSLAGHVDAQLHSAMCLVCGTIHSIPLLRLLVLGNIEPAAL